jgi:diguanylate cyclase (GGDEF)-like protein
MPISREKILYRNFIIATSIVTAVVLFGVFLSMANRTKQLLSEENLIQARVLLNTIVMTRKWNADHGGVYVVKRPGVESNPFLINPDVTTSDGRVLTQRNPALMTREISEYAAREGLFRFHLTSLNLLNPGNKPDDFERDALLLFETGKKKEVSRLEEINGRTHFRYMAPLYFEEQCQPCHGQQHYRTGDVRGGISITFDIEDLQKKIKHSTALILLFGTVTTASLLSLIFFFSSQFMKRLEEARSRIEMVAITDELTDLFNRRHLLNRFKEEFEKVKRLNTDLCCIIADIDHFKTVNDRYGHLMGDQVLKDVAHLFKSMVRVYDIVGRYGGEEFLIILPEIKPADAKQFAERMRLRVKEEITVAGPLTISLGVTAVGAGDHSIDDVIRRADAQLYRAKNAGRDRVE